MKEPKSLFNIDLSRSSETLKKKREKKIQEKKKKKKKKFDKSLKIGSWARYNGNKVNTINEKGIQTLYVIG